MRPIYILFLILNLFILPFNLNAATQKVPKFSGTIPNQTATVGTAFTFNASSYFSQTNGDTITYSKTGTLPSGISLNSTTGVLSGTPTASGTFNNIVIIGTDNDGSKSSNSFSFTVTSATADLSITKTVNDTTPIPGDTLTFTIVGKNNGPIATGVRITDTLPAGFTSITATENKSNFSCSISSQTVTCNSSSNFVTNDTATVTITAKMNNAGTLTNTANIVSTSSVTDATAGNNSASVTVTAAAVNPTITPETFNIYTNATVGNVVGTVSTTGSPTAFSILSGNTGNNFSINNSGTISIISTTNLNVGTYSLNIQATNGSLSGTGIITIVVDTYSVTNDSQREFIIRNPVSTRNIKGNLKVIGNTVLCWKNGTSTCQATTKSNNNLSLSFIDTNTTDAYSDSSQAQMLDIPTTASIVWAGFYTQGFLAKNKADTLTALNASPATLTTPTGSTINISPTVIDVFLYSNNQYTYATYSEVAGLKGLTGAQANGWFTGANIKAVQGQHSALGYYGAWTLVVIYQDNSTNSTETLKNISVYDGYKRVSSQTGYNNVDVTVSGFLTPTSGDVASTLSIFAGEGDIDYTGDKLYLNGTAINSTNAFNSSTSGFNATPDLANNSGIDIQNHNVGTSGLNIIGNSQQSATVKFTSSQDAYYPSMIAFTTELYEPRVCYKQEFFDASGLPIDAPNVGDTITINTYISNMKKDAADSNLETADKVEITMELDNTNLEYVANSLKMKNLGESVYYAKTDAHADDTMDFFTDTNSSKWRVGTGSSATLGGQLLPNTTGTDSKKAFITFQTKLLTEGDININNIYKVSYENALLGVRFGDESPLNIGVCQDVNTSLGVGGVAGAFNAVPTSFSGTSDPIEATNVLNALPTQVSSKPFSVKILSLNSDNIALKPYTGNVNVSIINTPNYVAGDNAGNQLLCNNATPINTAQVVNFANASSATLSVTNTTKATKNASFKIEYDLTSNPHKFACSRDVFAIRPEKFVLSTPSGNNINLLKSAQVYGFPLKATQYGTTTATNDYNITNANSILSIVKTTYQPTNTVDNSLNGALTFGTLPFQMANGDANATMKFDDVAKVNIQLKDTTWAAVDVTNGDTTGDCSATGSYICGDVNATFIPEHFALSGVHLNNNALTDTFTYLSDDLNMSARLDVTVTAKNLDNATTQNFKSGSWENPVDVNISVTSATATPTIIKDEIDANQTLGFTSGQITIPWDEPNATKKLSFNFNRDVNDSKNPFVILGSEVNVTAKSTYTNAGSTTITGSSVADLNATFIYGRSHAPRHRFSTPTGTALLYYESYCNGCDKTLLPNGVDSNSTDDPRWFINTNHTNTSGIAGTVTQKNSSNIVTVNTQPVGNHPDSVALTYDVTKGYPYKTTMENNASNWLIYNKYSAAATKNEFEVEFEGVDSNWSGKHETNTTTIRSGTDKTNRRTMW